MAKFKIGRPSQQVRLRNWPAGRLAEMRLMVSRLEEGLNDSLAARVKQGDKRTLNTNVPIIIQFTVIPGFRQFQVTFPLPPGLGGAGRGSVAHPERQLLYYEIQHDIGPGFTDPISVRSPQTNLIIGGVGLSEKRYFRARVVNTRFEVSPWTDTVASTAAAGSMIVTRFPDASTSLVSNFDEWVTIDKKSYSSGGGAVCVTATVSVGACQTDSGSYRSGPAMVQFRWQIDSNDGKGLHPWGDRTVLSARPGYTGVKDGKAAMAFGGFVSPFARLEATTIKIQLQAKKLPSCKWKGGDGSDPLRDSDPMLFVRNGKILEILETL